MARQRPPDPDPTTPDWTLNPQQETAVLCLASGQTISATAHTLGVCRQTVSEWLHHHPGFQAALHARREELWAGMADSLRGLLPKAVDVLKSELEGAHPLRAAVHVLKACGLYRLEPPHGPVEVQEVLLAHRERERARRQRALFADAF